jgi:hypothetical protein
MQKVRVISTTEILLADIADSLRILAKRPRLEIQPSGEVIVRGDGARDKPVKRSAKKPAKNPAKKRASAPKNEKTEGAGAPAKTGVKKPSRKSGGKKE